MGRVTKKQLEAVIEGINELTGSPLTYATVLKGGKRVMNIGHFYLDQAYGGYQCLRITNEGGGVEEISYGHVPARELMVYLRAFKKALHMVSAKNNYKKVQI